MGPKPWKLELEVETAGLTLLLVRQLLTPLDTVHEEE